MRASTISLNLADMFLLRVSYGPEFSVVTSLWWSRASVATRARNWVSLKMPEVGSPHCRSDFERYIASRKTVSEDSLCRCVTGPISCERRQHSSSIAFCKSSSSTSDGLPLASSCKKRSRRVGPGVSGSLTSPVCQLMIEIRLGKAEGKVFRIQLRINWKSYRSHRRRAGGQ